MSDSTITNPKRAGQLMNYINLQFGKVMPSDIDAILDLKGQAWVIIEAKSGKASVPLGQRILLERMAKDLGSSRPTYVLVARHKTPVAQQVDLGNCKVGTVYENGVWYDIDTHWESPTVREYIDSLIMRLQIAELQEHVKGVDE